MHKFINLSKYSYISIHDVHGLMMMNDIHIDLNHFNTVTSDGSKYIITTFNIYIYKNVCVYTFHSCSIFTFLNNLQTIIQHIIGDFNVDILNDNNKAKINNNYYISWINYN